MLFLDMAKSGDYVLAVSDTLLEFYAAMYPVPSSGFNVYSFVRL